LVSLECLVNSPTTWISARSQKKNFYICLSLRVIEFGMAHKFSPILNSKPNCSQCHLFLVHIVPMEYLQEVASPCIDVLWRLRQAWAPYSHHGHSVGLQVPSAFVDLDLLPLLEQSLSQQSLPDGNMAATAVHPLFSFILIYSSPLAKFTSRFKRSTPRSPLSILLPPSMLYSKNIK